MATWMRRGNGWYCVFCAAARLQVPLVALSSDLPDSAAQHRRNEEILETHRPLFLIFDDSADRTGLANSGRAMAALDALRSIAFPELWEQAWAVDRRPASEAVATADATLCYCYTGGTTKASRCARITHRMALHEVAAYPRIVNLGHEDSVLQQHSLYWAASAYGEVDIALAFGCALVFCEAWDAEGVASAIKANSVTCAGLVPSILAALEPRDVPSLRTVFTWGEALQPRVAREWAQRVHLLDLLISTECWLSLYADWTAEVKANCSGSQSQTLRPPFQALPEVKVQLRAVTAENGSDLAAIGPSSVGELMVAGPMVSPGYTDALKSSESFEGDARSVRWYRTRDCLEQRPDGGFVFAGRADELVKVAGVWVDIRDVEARLAAVEGVAEACVCGRRAFVALESLGPGVMHSLRAILPADFLLCLVPAPFPRNAGTGKVDRRRLAELADMSAASKSLASARESKERRLCVEDLASLLGWYRPLCVVGAAALLRAGLFLPLSSLRPAAGGCLASFLACQLPRLVLPFGLRVVGELAWRLPCVSYMVLWSYHWNAMTAACRNLPIGVHTLAVAAGAAAPSPAWGLAFAAPGMFLAARGGRLLSWPLVCGVGFPLWARDCGYWLPESIREHGYRGVASWYFWKVVRSFSHNGRCGMRSGLTSLQKAKRRLERCVGRTRRCGWCRELLPASFGSVDPLVDSRSWYCEKCWDIYNKFEECKQCKRWTKKDFLSHVAGALVCYDCTQSAAAAAKADGQKPTGEGSPANGADGGRGRKRPASETWSPSTVRVTFTLSDPATGPREDLNGKVQEHEEAEAAASSNAREPAPKRLKGREWRLVERATGLQFETLSDPLVGLDSMRRTKMTSVLRRELGKRLTREAIQRSSTLGDLLGELARLPDEAQVPAAASRSSRRSYATWGIMWYSRCQWTLRRSRALPEATLRKALTQLVERHEALRAELRDPYRLFGATQQALTVFELWRRHSRALCSHLGAAKAARRLLGHRTTAALERAGLWAGRALDRAVRWSFRNAWPRAGAAASARPNLRVLKRTATPEEADQELYRAARVFAPPFEAVLAPYGGVSQQQASGEGARGDGAPAADEAAAPEGAFLRLAATHMLSDGYSVVPLLSDLAQLVAQAEASEDSAAAGEDSPPLPPVPSMLCAMEPRIMQTVDGELAADGWEGGITREPVGKRWGPQAQTVYAYLPAEAVAIIRRAARQLAVPEDIAMLTGISVALARFEGRRSQPVAMIVPQRDGPAENDMVGLFADVRHLFICTGGLSYAGVVLHVHHIVEQRLWHAPGLATQMDLPLVNFEWTDFEELHGFSQHVNMGEWPENARHPLKVAVEQPDRETWRMRISFDREVYSQSRRDDFLRLLDSSLRALNERPLDLVWPEDAGGASGRRCPVVPPPEAAPAAD